MTKLEQELVELDLFYSETVKPFYERRDALMQRIKEELPVGHMFQAEDGTVFEIVQPKGTFVSYQQRSYDRTRRGYLGEKKGGLSLKRAEESGFVLGPGQKTVTDHG